MRSRHDRCGEIGDDGKTVHEETVMHDQDTTADLRKYHVVVGHAETTVRCRTSVEAIRLARRGLSEEMPRLWDVIHRIDDKEFRVDLIS